MARIARGVVPDLPHHVTQRGNRREPVFFGAGDYRLYRRLITAAAARRAGAEIWAYSLMPNHVHLIVTPTGQGGLRATFPEAYRRCTGAVARLRWTGYLIQGCFGAVVMDEPHLLAATRDIALNPVAAGLVSRAEGWPCSSARAHLAGEDDELATAAPLRALIPDYAAPLTAPADPMTTARIERAPTIGRPLGARSGSQRSSGSSAGAWHAANRAQSPEPTRTRSGNWRYSKDLDKLSP